MARDGQMRIRAMLESDLDEVMAVAYSLKDAPQWRREAYSAAISASHAPRRVALIAEDPDGAVMGFVVGSLIAPEAELESIGVSAEAQGHGIGKALLDGWTAEARAAGATALLLEVRASNRRARRFYQAAGFVEAGCRPAYYRDPIEDALVLRQKLISQHP